MLFLFRKHKIESWTSTSNVASFVEVLLKGVEQVLEALSLMPQEAVVEDALERWRDAPLPGLSVALQVANFSVGLFAKKNILKKT